MCVISDFTMFLLYVSIIRFTFYYSFSVIYCFFYYCFFYYCFFYYCFFYYCFFYYCFLLLHLLLLLLCGLEGFGIGLF